MTQVWVYVKSEPNLWTVGYYSYDGKWHSDSDWETKEEAVERVSYLNGDRNRVVKKTVKKPSFHYISYSLGSIDLSLFEMGNDVSVDATGFRNDPKSMVEIHITKTCIVLDGNQAKNLKHALTMALESDDGKYKIINIGE